MRIRRILSSLNQLKLSQRPTPFILQKKLLKIQKVYQYVQQS